MPIEEGKVQLLYDTTIPFKNAVSRRNLFPVNSLSGVRLSDTASKKRNYTKVAFTVAMEVNVIRIKAAAENRYSVACP